MSESMPTLTKCPQCSRKLNVPDNLVGKRVKCPGCGENFSMLDEDESSLPARHSPLAPEYDYEEVPDDESWDDDDRGRRRRRRRRRRRDDYDDRDRGTASQGNGMAVAGMVLGIIGFVFSFIPCAWVLGMLLGIKGVIFSGIGLGHAAKVGQGKGMAVTGLIMSILAIIWAPIWIFLLMALLFSVNNPAFHAQPWTTF
jgi:hypothetical protein